MVNSIVRFFGRFGVWFVVLVCACVPGIETKIAVPLGASQIWGESSLTLLGAGIIAFLASTIFALLLFFVSKITLNSLKKHKKLKFLLKILKKLELFLQKPINLISQKKSSKLFFVLVLFVASPLPVCGLFSGAILCAMLNIKNSIAVCSLVLGNLLDTIFVVLLCFAFKPFLSLILSVFLIITILVGVFFCLKHITKKFTKTKQF